MAVREDLGSGLEDEAGQVDGLLRCPVRWGPREDLDRDAGCELHCGDRSRRRLLRGQAWSEEAGECNEGDEREQAGFASIGVASGFLS